MTAPTILYPASFSATASLSLMQCQRLDALKPSQRAELDAGRAYLAAINHPATPRGLTHRDLPADFRAKVAAYSQALMDRQMGQVPAS